MIELEIGPLYLNFHRTVRVRLSEQTANLPPSLGLFEIFKVSDYDKVPAHWNKNGYFIAIGKEEAVWLSFQSLSPVAILIGAGGINAVSGEKFTPKLEKDNYLVTPPQPWLDGWKGEKDEIYQFVATEIGENKTISEQFNEIDQSLTISVYDAHNKEFVNKRICRSDTTSVSEYGCHKMQVCCAAPVASLDYEVGLGKGGKICQKIYEDPHGLDVWKSEPEKTVKVYLMDAASFSEVTGKQLPPLVSAEQYNGIWYGQDDLHIASIKGHEKFTKLKNAF